MLRQVQMAHDNYVQLWKIINFFALEHMHLKEKKNYCNFCEKRLSLPLGSSVGPFFKTSQNLPRNTCILIEYDKTDSGAIMTSQ